MSRRPGRDEHCGMWVLVADRLQLLAVGERAFGGNSPRKVLDWTARSILLPRLQAALVAEADGEGRHFFDQRSWRSRVIPIRSPLTQTIVAAAGCYVAEDTSMSDPPPVGAWEWRVTPPGPDQIMRSWWTPALFDVHGIRQPSGPNGVTWEGPQWIDELIVTEDRPAVRRRLDDFLRADTDQLITLDYAIRTPEDQIHRLRMAGRPYTDDPGPDRYFRGVTMRVNQQANTQPGPDQYLAAVISLTTDPIGVVDTVYEHLYLTSRGFTARLGLAPLPADHYLPTITHPADLADLRALLKDASGKQTAVGPVRVRLAAAGGGWRTIEVTGRSVESGDGDSLDVVCRFVRSPDPAPTVAKVSNSVTGYLQLPGTWFLANAGWVTGHDQTLLIDTAATEARAQLLVATARSFGRPGNPLTTVVTHEHGDHANGAGLVARSGGQILASPSAAETILCGPHYYSQVVSGVRWGNIAPPESIFPVTEPVTMDLGGVTAEIIPVPGVAHTSGDLVVWVPDDGVLFTGDLAFEGVTPLAVHGSIAGWLSALTWIEATFDARSLVPGHGPVMSGKLTELRDYLQWLLDSVSDTTEPDFTALHHAALDRWPQWHDTERHIVNLRVAHADVHGTQVDVKAVFSEMLWYRGDLIAPAL